jgi:hypothetical protein
LRPPNKFLADSTFSAGKVRQSDRLSEPNACDAPPAVAVLSIHLNTDISLALRRTTSPWPVFNSDDPSSTRLTLYRLVGSVSPPSTQRFQRSERQTSRNRVDRCDSRNRVRPHFVGNCVQPQQHHRRNLQVEIAHVNAPARSGRSRVFPFERKTGRRVPEYSPWATGGGRPSRRESPGQATDL